MKRLLFAFFILLITNAIHASGVPNGDFKKFQIGLNASPDIAYLAFGRDGIISNRILKNAEAPKLGFTGGLNACYNFSSLLGLEVGLQYSNKGYQLIKLPLNASGNQATDPIHLSVLYNLNYIDIPVKANFTLGSGKVKFFGSAGLVTNVFIQERRTVWQEYTDRTEKAKYITPKGYEHKSLYLSAMASAGISWQLSDNFSLRIEPTYRLRIPPTGYSVTGKTYLINAGLNFGFYVGL